MLTIHIGNKAYSSWSLRGWLAVRQSGLAYTEVLTPLDTPAFAAVKATYPAGVVPVLEHDGATVWNSLAIIEYLADLTGRDGFWPADRVACAHARSIAAEMQSSFGALRRECPMNVRRHHPGFTLAPDAAADAARVDAIWTDARARFGADGDFLFGAFGAADIMFAPVVSRFVSYDIARSDASGRFIDAVMAHPFMVEWVDAGVAEPWVLGKYEFRDAA